MNRSDYINRLQACLYPLPPEEREAALEFYNEYFDDAGSENEARVIAELGPPEELAKQILSSCQSERYAPPGYAPPPDPARPRMRGWQIALLIIGFPFWFPLLATVMALCVTLALVLLVLMLIPVLVAVILIVAGIASLVVSIAGFAAAPLAFIVDIGWSLISLGSGLLLIAACALALRKAILPLFRRMRRQSR